jgi:hypothetical protein
MSDGRHVYQAIGQVAAAMAKLGINKGGRNESQGFAFRGIDQVLDALSTPLVEAGLIVLPRVTNVARETTVTAKGTTQFSSLVTVDYHLTSTKDGSTVVVTFVGEAKDSGDKATSKALSMAFKYFAFQAFCIPVSGCDDADQTTPEPSVAKATPKLDAATRTAMEDGLNSAAAAGFDAVLQAVQAAATVEELADLRKSVGQFGKDKHPNYATLKGAYTQKSIELANKQGDSK